MTEFFCSLSAGEWLTRGTVWLALLLYVASETAGAAWRPADSTPSLSRSLNAAGCAAFFAHVLCAFAYYHHWSHAVAYADTARQTAQLTGWHWGGGLFVNYAFALIWLAEITWSFVNPNSYTARPRWLTRTVCGFFLFMIFNGGVVFAHAGFRWFGILLCLVLLIDWGRRERHDATSR